MRVVSSGLVALALVVTLASSRPHPIPPTMATNYGTIPNPAANAGQSWHSIVDMSHLPEYAVPCSSTNPSTPIPDGQDSDHASLWSTSTAYPDDDKGDIGSAGTLTPLQHSESPRPRPYNPVLSRSMGIAKATGLTAALGCVALMSCLEGLERSES